jgi:uncharacterized protein (TIGR02001 family)
MYKSMLTALIAAVLFSPMTYASVEGSIGVDSDYFFRGVSQNDGEAANSVNLTVKGDGFYAGTWGSQVNVNGEADWEFNFYAGYALAMTDSMELDVGIIQYAFDTLHMDEQEEVYINVSSGNWNLSHFRNVDDTDLAFSQVEYRLPFISQVDVSLLYAMHSDESAAVFGKDDTDYFGMKFSKSFNNVELSAMIMDGARHGNVMDNASVGLHYNF